MPIISKAFAKQPSANMAKPCHFFDKLPPELRNEVYKLAFASDDDSKGIRLIDAAPPSKALIVTCRQTHAESAKLYKAMYRDYWRTNKFLIEESVSYGYQSRLTDHVPVNRAMDVDHIEHLTVILDMTSLNPLAPKRIMTITLEDSRGLWSLNDDLLGVGVKVVCKNEGNRWAALGATYRKQEALGWLSQVSSYSSVMDQLRYFTARCGR